jgi:hypothetical protein
VRKARVNERTGQYEPGHSSVTVNGDRDIFGESQFAARVGTWISNYHFYERGWTDPDKGCAKAVFSPASNTLRLRKGQSSSVSMYANAAKDGARAKGARWTLSSPVNATFSPTSVRGAAPSVQYHVTAAPPNGHVLVTVKFTSTAGAGKGSWTQPVKDVLTINHIAGTFDGSYSIPTGAGPSVLSWTGAAKFDRSGVGFYGAIGQFTPKSGSYDVTASGVDGSFATTCQQSGTMHVDIGPTTGAFTVFPHGTSLDPPYDYSVTANGVSAEGLTITRHDCPPSAADMEGTTAKIATTAPGLDTGSSSHHTPNGIDYVGSSSESNAGIVYAQTWTFHGTP